ncbi:hypothetical protein EI42_06244 [Thermosporothrix hazakensis]|uniref:Uncharacterized protein n=1 Tax=Thermosporothrix hazakensis TaxID=644383 RepID=A0A326U004_THEHA|nr:hypothetical protein EI42_06244 [Thermosporothrix hazakensis]GCE49254.1 hypothetical protein KTH_41230 [Thermosporothrix hazakensis]
MRVRKIEDEIRYSPHLSAAAAYFAFTEETPGCDLSAMQDGHDSCIGMCISAERPAISLSAQP